MGVIGQESAQSLWLGLRNRPVEELRPLAGIAIGLLLGLVSLVIYMAEGYSKWMLWLWLAALVVLSVAFWLRSRALPRIALADVGIAGGLIVLVSPLYLLALSRWPVQVSSDETTVLWVSDQYAHATGVDPFGVSWYLTRPAGLFIVWGKLGELLGGIDLGHMRLLHALVSLLTIGACYVFFRLLLPRYWAAFATIIVATGHSYFMIGRLAMRETTAVLVLVVAFTLLLWGLREKHELATFLGGVVAGLGFYVYYPARVTLPLWIIFLVGVGLLFRRKFPRRTLLTLGAIAVAGLVLSATPIVYSESQVPVDQAQGQRDSLLVYSDARELQRQWLFEDSQFDAYVTNVKYGLGTFNNKVADHGWIYANYGHGFVDPVTGVLLWLGVGLVGVGLIRRRREDVGALLMLGGFLVLWLSFAFVVNKAPNYTRLLVTLPFVAFFLTEAVRWLAGRWKRIPRASGIVACGFLAAIVVWNLSIAWDYVDTGRRDGDPIGSTGRYVEARKDNSGQLFYMSTSASQPYYVWGDDTASNSRLRYFVDKPTQIGLAVDPGGLRDFNAPPPFSLLMRREVWQSASTELADRYPSGRIRNVTPDGARVVLEVPS